MNKKILSILHLGLLGTPGHGCFSLDCRFLQGADCPIPPNCQKLLQIPGTSLLTLLEKHFWGLTLAGLVSGLSSSLLPAGRCWWADGEACPPSWSATLSWQCPFECAGDGRSPQANIRLPRCPHLAALPVSSQLCPSLADETGRRRSWASNWLLDFLKITMLMFPVLSLDTVSPFLLPLGVSYVLLVSLRCRDVPSLGPQHLRSP